MNKPVGWKKTFKIAVILASLAFLLTFWIGTAIRDGRYDIVKNNQSQTPDNRTVKCTHILQPACYKD